MARLLDALRGLGLSGRVDPSGRWLTLDGEGCRVFVAAARRGGGHYTWCDDPAERVVEHFPDPRVAILAGLRRATEVGLRKEATEGARDGRTTGG